MFGIIQPPFMVSIFIIPLNRAKFNILFGAKFYNYFFKESSLTLCFIYLFANHVDHFGNILLAGAVVRCFDHKLVACYTPQRDM